MSAVTRIHALQRAWARGAGYRPDGKGYLRRVDDNLWRPLHPATRAEVERGSGGELHSRSHRPAKMRALHSSAALACNFFDFWRDRDKAPLTVALGLTTTIAELSFEAQLPTGLQGTPPHLDLLLTLQSGTRVAIESKFTELYSSRRTVLPFKAKYFAKGRRLWADVGLPRCQELAESIQRGRRRFNVFDPGQLLKHALGIATEYRDRGSLLYIFYDDTGGEGAQHRKEVSEFAELLGGELGFRALAYQQAFRALQSLNSADGTSYTTYLRDRYFRA